MSSAASSSSQQSACSKAATTLGSGRLIGPAAVYAWLFFAACLFLLQTLPYLSYRWVTDESWYAASGYSIAHGHGAAVPAMGPNDVENRLDARPPGTALVIATAFRLLGTSQIPARLGSIVAGLGIIFLTYCLARNVIGNPGALVATFLVATDNLIVLTSRSARPEAYTTMMILASLLAIKQYAESKRLSWAFVTGFLLAVGTMFHVTLLGYIVTLGILVIVLDCKRSAFPLRGAICCACGYGLGLLPFVIWLLTSPLGGAGFREEYLGKAKGLSLWLKFLQEGHRYSDLLGFNMLHGHGLESIPVRLPIPLFFVAASFFLWKLRRRWFYLELLLLIPTALWFIYTANKSSRYLAILAPIFALAIGAAITATKADRKLRNILLVLSCMVVIAQIFANLVLLHAARNADYNKVAAELRSVIPPGETAYGTITFWLALHDHPFISYERTDPWMAANQFHARYFIAGDRMMTNGDSNDEVFHKSLNQGMAEIIFKSRLVGHFPDPYYGDLRVYERQGP
jgi:4-amino-4-deoxy-L-arabinose transferase-like glycosyltransferase